MQEEFPRKELPNPVLCKYMYGEKIPKRNFTLYHDSENFEKYIKIELNKLQKQYPVFEISFERNGFTVRFEAKKK